MTTLETTNALRLLQAADQFRAALGGEFSAVHGMSVNEFLMLLHLNNATLKRLPRVDLGKRMHVSASTITRMAAPMEKIGLLAKHTDDRDARLSFVVLTKTGQDKLADVLATFEKRAQYLFRDTFSAEELDQMARLLRRITPEPLEA